MASESELKPIKNLRQPFEIGRKAIEKLVVLARKMPPEDQEGGWGKWSYSRGMGRGKLYSEFGSDGLAAFPGGEWYHNRGGEKESLLRIFFGFQENRPGVLQLEQFGSQTQGCFAIDPLEVDSKLQFEVENIKIRQTLNLKDLDSRLRYDMAHGISNSTRLERIFIP